MEEEIGVSEQEENQNGGMVKPAGKQWASGDAGQAQGGGHTIHYLPAGHCSIAVTFPYLIDG